MPLCWTLGKASSIGFPAGHQHYGRWQGRNNRLESTRCTRLRIEGALPPLQCRLSCLQQTARPCLCPDRAHAKALPAFGNFPCSGQSRLRAQSPAANDVAHTSHAKDAVHKAVQEPEEERGSRFLRKMPPRCAHAYRCGAQQEKNQPFPTRLRRL